MRIRLADLPAGTRHLIQVRATDGRLFSEWSVTHPFTTDTDKVPPLAPTGLAGMYAGTTISATWNAVTTSVDGTPAYDLDAYQVIISSEGTATTGTYVTKDTKFQFDINMNRVLFGRPRNKITITVKAMDRFGNISAGSTPVTVIIPPPNPPTNVTLTGAMNSLIGKWTPSDSVSAVGYKVYLGTSADFTPGNAVWLGNASSATIDTIQYTTDQWIKVTAYDGFEFESTAVLAGPARPTSPVTVDVNPPAVPTNLAATLTNAADGRSASAAVSWTAVPNPDNDLAEYIIGYKPSSDTGWQYVKVDYTLAAVTITGLLPYTNYDFRIRASDFTANLSNWSTILTKTAVANVAPAVPTGLTVIAGMDTLNISWDENTEANMKGGVGVYDVTVATNSGFTTGVLQYRTGATSLAIAGLDPNTDYYVRVRAVNSGGKESAYSATETASTGSIEVDPSNIPPNSLDVNVLKSSTLTTKTLTIGASGKIIVDATGEIKSNNYEADSTGYRLSKDGLEVNDGSIDAKALKAGSAIIGDIIVGQNANANGAVKSFGYAAGSKGWKIDKSGIEVNEGSISAGALKIQDSQNLMPVEYADFEFNPNFYVTGEGAGATLYGDNPPTITEVISSIGARFNRQYLSATWTASGEWPYFNFTFGRSWSDYNIPVEEGQEYIVSFYARASGSSSTSISMNGYFDDPVSGDIVLVDVTLPGGNSAWRRYSTVVTAPAGATAMQLWMQAEDSPSGGFHVDGIQVERKVGGVSEPSPWTPPTSTSVDGGIIRTGEIRSNTNVIVNGSTQPAWSINMSGGAQFGDALIRGSMIVGTTTDSDKSFIASGNYVSGSKGWKIDSSGAAEFNSGVFRGDVRIGGAQNNVVPNGVGEWKEFGGWLTHPNLTFNSTDVPAEIYGAVNGPANNLTVQGEGFWPVEPGEEFYAEIWMKADKPNSRMYVELRDQTNARLGSGVVAAPGEAFAGGSGYLIQNSIAPTTWTKYSAIVTPTAGMTQLRIGGVYFNHSNGTEQAAVQSIAIRIRRRQTNALLVDGAITAEKLSVGAIQAQHIGVGVLGTNLISDPSFEDGTINDAEMGTYYANRVEAARQRQSGWSRYATVSSSTCRAVKNYGGYRSGSVRLQLGHLVGGENQYVGDVANSFKVDVGQKDNGLLYALGDNTGTLRPRLTVTVLYGTAENNINSTVTSSVISSQYVDQYPTTADKKGGDWHVFKGEFVVPSGQAWAALQIEKSIMSGITLTGNNWLYIDDVSVLKESEGGASELTAAGLRLFDASGDETAAFVANRANYFSVTRGTNDVVSINGFGDVSVNTLSIGADRSLNSNLDPATTLDDAYGLSIGGLDLAERLWKLPQGNVASAWTTGAVTFGQINTEVGLFECAFEALPGRRYRIEASNIQFDSTAAGFISLKLRATTGNTNPTITSPLRVEARGWVDSGSTSGGVDGSIDTLNFFWTPVGETGSSTICRVLLTASRISGGYPWVRAYDTNRAIRILIEDIGPSSDLVNGYKVNRGGGSWYAAPPAPIEEPPTTTRYTKYYSSTGWASYGLNGTGTIGTRNPNTGNVYHGYYSGTQGDQFGQYTFNTGLNQPSITIVKAELEITCAGAYYNAGINNVKVRSGTGGLSATALTTTAKNVGTFSKGQKRLVDITSVFAKSHTKVQIGKADTTSLNSYGYFGSSARLKITYDQTL